MIGDDFTTYVLNHYPKEEACFLNDSDDSKGNPVAVKWLCNGCCGDRCLCQNIKHAYVLKTSTVKKVWYWIMILEQTDRYIDA